VATLAAALEVDSKYMLRLALALDVATNADW
jgi:hypothetical protein